MAARIEVAWAFGLLAWAGLCTSAGVAPADAGPADRLAPRIELGCRLFFDPAVSRSGTNACATCYGPLRGFADPRRHSSDGGGKETRVDGALEGAGGRPK